ncbi:GNAT family N-acetyltransferase [Cellulomonas chitinilytica]|uniref:GNAT family N-acetyltransferase n=1 Tax=Cellulomonas chitinilytica TaxID=398759 RepID=UPI001941CF65|nr:GNAT family N-acetyltransferase [Cellulomonas chitinilytica]
MELLASGDREAVRAILDDLPQWFGRPEATAAYVAAADTFPQYVAVTAAGERVGVALVQQHFPVAAEIHLIAVAERWHRRGVGRALLTRIESDLRRTGTRILTVKTLGAADPDEGYRRTRLFYEGTGFLPLEEFTDLWPGTPCLYLAKPLG